MPRRAARAAITCASPTITTRPGNRSRASNAQRSGPMPAGSPAVSATSGSALVVAVLDEGTVAHLAQPVLVRLVSLALADRLAHGHLLALLGELVRTALEYLHQVPAEGRLHGLAHFAVLQLVHGPFELRHGVARRDPTQVAALGGAAVFRIELRDLGEILALGDALAQPLELLPDFGLGNSLAGAQQDVAHVGLLDPGHRGLAALLEQLEDVEAVRAAEHVAHFAGLQALQRFQEERGKPARRTPAELPALQRVRCIGVGRRDLREVAA